MTRSRFVVALIILTFFVISFLTNIIGPIVPEIIEDFSLSLTLVSILPFSFFLAYGLTSIPAGFLVERFNAKRVMIAAFVIAFFGALTFAVFPAFPVAVASLFLIGTGMAFLEVSVQPLLRVCGGEEHYAFNSALGQLFFGTASFLSPLVYSYLVLNLPEADGPLLSTLASLVPDALPWLSLYWISALVALIMVTVVALSPIPSVATRSEGVHLDLLRRPQVIAYFLGIFCYVGTEQGVATWLSEYLLSYHEFDPQTSGARAVSMFWGMMTLGTIFGLLAFKLFDTRHVMIGFGSLAMVSLAVGLSGSAGVAFYALPATGFFISVLWSSIMSLALNSITEHHGSVAGILVTGVVGGAIIPVMIGWIGDFAGLRTGLLVLFGTLLYMISIGFWARPLIKNKTLRTKDVC